MLTAHRDMGVPSRFSYHISKDENKYTIFPLADQLSGCSIRPAYHMKHITPGLEGVQDLKLILNTIGVASGATTANLEEV